MVLESVRGYVELASGLGDLTRARAVEAAQGLLSLPAAGVATGTKMAGQAGALADELLAAAMVNRSNLTALVRSEVDLAITALGLVSVQKLAEAESAAEELRAEVAKLRSAPPKAAAPAATPKAAATPRGTTKKAAAAPKTAAAKAAAAPRGTARKAAVAPKTAAAKAAATPRGTARKAAAAPKTAAAKAAAAPRGTARKAAAASKTARTPAKASTVRRSAVTTRTTPVGT